MHIHTYIYIYTIFNGKKGAMNIKPALCGISIRKPLCGWLMRRSYAEGFIAKKPLCGALCCIKLIRPIQRLMRHKALHKATLRKKLYALYAGSDAARECRKKTLCAFFIDFFSVGNSSEQLPKMTKNIFQYFHSKFVKRFTKPYLFMVFCI